MTIAGTIVFDCEPHRKFPGENWIITHLVDMLDGENFVFKAIRFENLKTQILVHATVEVHHAKRDRMDEQQAVEFVTDKVISATEQFFKNFRFDIDREKTDLN